MSPQIKPNSEVLANGNGTHLPAQKKKVIGVDRDKIYEALPQIIAVSIKNVLLMGYGMTLGFPTILIPTLQGGDQIVLNPEQISWISSINLICVPLGCLFSGIVTQPLGRKRSMQLVNIPFMAAWLIFHWSTTAGHLYAALALTGLGGGLMEAPVITYVAEITQPHLRGMLSATSSMTIIFGIFCQFLLGIFLHWRTVALINLTLPIIAVLLLFIVPESPHWLVLKGRLEDARGALQWLRGWTTPEKVDGEFRELCVVLGKQTEHLAFDKNWSDDKATAVPAHSAIIHVSKNKVEFLKRFGTRSFLLPYALVCFTFFLGQFSGMTTLQIFAVQIFQTLKSPIDKYYATMLLGIVELLGSLLCVLTVHRFGKRPLTFFSIIGVGLCNIIVATYAYLINVQSLEASIPRGSNFTEEVLLDDNINMNVTILGVNAESLQWVPTTFLIGSAFLNHAAIRLLPWVLIGEVFPTELRGIASGLAGGVGYIFGFIASKIFLSMIQTITLPGVYWFYGFVSLFGATVLYFVLPETEGRTLHDIELHFLGVKKIRKKDGVYKKSKENKAENGEVNLGFSDKNEVLDSRLTSTFVPAWRQPVEEFLRPQKVLDKKAVLQTFSMEIILVKVFRSTCSHFRAFLEFSEVPPDLQESNGTSGVAEHLLQLFQDLVHLHIDDIFDGYNSRERLQKLIDPPAVSLKHSRSFLGSLQILEVHEGSTRVGWNFWSS